MADRQKSIFITGAASGIGRATARLFAEKGWFIGAVDVNEANLADLKQEIGEAGCFTHVLDVTDRDAFKNAIDKFGEATSGKLDILHNNAGIGYAGLFQDIPFEKHLAVINVNLIGVMIGVYTALPLFNRHEQFPVLYHLLLCRHLRPSGPFELCGHQACGQGIDRGVVH